MLDLDLLRFQHLLRMQRKDGQPKIWDPIRKKWLVSGPEELVRQLVIRYLLDELQFPSKLIHVEKLLMVHRRQRRFDVLLYNRDLSPVMLIECKRPEVSIRQNTFDQISRYNIALKVPYLLVTNGNDHHLCRIDYQTQDYTFLPEIPPLLSPI